LLQHIQPILQAEDIAYFRGLIRQIIVEPNLLEFIAQLVMATRNNPSLYLGASPRASLAILQASKALAAMRGRDFITPEDILEIAPHVLRHRIILSPEIEMEGLTPDELIQQLISKIVVPR
jgi:MoxR-like ATPase